MLLALELCPHHMLWWFVAMLNHHTQATPFSMHRTLPFNLQNYALRPDVIAMARDASSNSSPHQTIWLPHQTWTTRRCFLTVGLSLGVQQPLAFCQQFFQTVSAQEPTYLCNLLMQKSSFVHLMYHILCTSITSRPPSHLSGHSTIFPAQDFQFLYLLHSRPIISANPISCSVNPLFQ